MRPLRLTAFALVLFLASGVAVVYANTGEGTVGLPILGTTGAPALTAPNVFSGVITVLYADGTPVVLESDQVALDLCGFYNYNNATTTTAIVVATSTTTGSNGTTCATVTAGLNQTGPGIYTYSFIPPSSLTGTVTIFIRAYGLADDNGRIFPQVDTSIGTYAYTPSNSHATGSNVPPTSSVPPSGNQPAPLLSNQAVNAQPTAATSVPSPSGSPTSPIEPLLIALSVLAIAGAVLTVSKRRSNN